MECPKCHTKNPKDALFCMKCGTKLERKCPKCGAEYSEEAVFCMKCGNKLIGTGLAPAKETVIPKLEDMHSFSLANVKPNAGLKKFADDQATALKEPLTSIRFLKWVVKKITGK